MLHSCDVRFDVTENLENFLVFVWTKQGLGKALSSSDHAGRTWAARAAEPGAEGAMDGGFLGASGGTSMATQ